MKIYLFAFLFKYLYTSLQKGKVRAVLNHSMIQSYSVQLQLNRSPVKETQTQ